MKAQEITEALSTFDGESEVLIKDGKGNYYRITDILPYQQHGHILMRTAPVKKPVRATRKA